MISEDRNGKRESFPEWKHVGLYLMIYLSVERQLYMWHWLRGSVRFNLCETVMPLCVHVRCINHSLHILAEFRSTAEKSDLNSSLARMVYMVNMKECVLGTQTRINPYWRYSTQSDLSTVLHLTSTHISGTNNWHESWKTLMDILHEHFQTQSAAYAGLALQLCQHTIESAPL